MTTAKTLTKSSSAAPTDRATDYAQAVVSRQIVAGPHVRNACQRHLADLVRGHERGLRYDLAAAQHVWRFFENVFFLSEGQFEGLPFRLDPSQAFILGCLFGWKRADGTRRFRRAFIEQGKGNGKSPLAGGIGLYGLTADDEAGAQIYAAAAKKEQAGILFQDACKMVRQSPALLRKLNFSGGMGREFNIAHHASQSFFRPISKDAGKTGSGPRPHFALCDEVHEHPDRSVMEILERGFKFRRQPLLLMITNSGSNRQTVCWEEHEHAVRVAAGTKTPDESFSYVGEPLDDTTFSYVCALDTKRNEPLTSERALRFMEEVCSCGCAKTIQTGKSTAEGFALRATLCGGEKTERLSVQTTQTGSETKADSAKDVTTKSADQTLNIEQKNEPRSESGKKKTRESCEATSSRGSLESLDTEAQSKKSNPLESMGLQEEHTQIFSHHRAEDAQYARKSPEDRASQSTTAMGRTSFEGFSASHAIQQSVSSETLRGALSAHSDTCDARKRSRIDGTTLWAEFPADDPLEDPTCWPKANPLLGVTITEEYLSDVVRQAKALPGKLNGILRLHFCTWTDSDEAWMSRAALESVLDDFDPAEHIGRPMYAGLDLSATRDLTASAYVVETGYTDVTRPDGTVATLPTYDAWVDAWTPADTLTQRALSDDAPYDVWVEQGWLISVPGPIVRYDYVAAHLAGMIAEGYDIQALAYDSYAFQRLFLPELDAAGVTVPVVSHPQGGKRKSAGSDLWMPGSKRTLESLILEGRIRLRRSPVLISAMMSAAIEPDPLDNTSFSKQRAVNRIDALIALTMAVGLATSGDVMDGPSIYDRMTDAQAASFGLQSTAPAVQMPVDGARISVTDRQILADPHHPGWQAARERYDMALAAADEDDF